MNAKLEKLETLLKGYERVAVAYSGGVDSTFLLAVAHKVLGDDALGVIGRSPTYPKREMDDAVRIAAEMGARFEVVDTCEMDNPDFASNPSNRCFFCKSNLFEVVGSVAKQHGIQTILEGSNAWTAGVHHVLQHRYENMRILILNWQKRLFFTQCLIAAADQFSGRIKVISVERDDFEHDAKPFKATCHSTLRS